MMLSSGPAHGNAVTKANERASVLDLEEYRLNDRSTKKSLQLRATHFLTSLSWLVLCLDLECKLLEIQVV